jgi:hypothetical protein
MQIEIWPKTAFLYVTDELIYAEVSLSQFYECGNILCNNSILLYELHKTSIVEREGLGDDERSEECSEGTSCLVKRV